MMNGYEKDHFDDEPTPGSFVKAFDAFPKAKPQYVTRTSGGGKWTVAMMVVSVVLFWSELSHWWRGAENHTFSVEQNVGHNMQINLDIVVRMQCQDLNVNVQDASGDRIKAGTRLQEDPTGWSQWVDAKGMHKLGHDANGRVNTGAGWHDEGFGQEHVHDIVAARKKAKFAKTPMRFGRGPADSCRIYGNLELNKVQGDFHITARGHGYAEFGEHLDHKTFNFSHIVSEFSFGPFYPSLVNPLDRTVNLASSNFHKFQYFMSVVPTIYSVGRAGSIGSKVMFTNQYAVTEQSHEISERMVPGIFFKYDIEPILLAIEESRDGILTLLMKVVNLFSGVLVAGHWGFTISEWIKEVLSKRRRKNEGVIGAKTSYD